MKLFKRSNTYKASNVSFNLNTNEAYSYDWWCFFKVINGKNVFNSYRYSPSTGGHQSKVRSLLNELNIKIDIDIECPKGLQSSEMKASSRDHYESQITELENAINKPRSQKNKNIERENQITALKELILDIQEL